MTESADKNSRATSADTNRPCVTQHTADFTSWQNCLILSSNTHDKIGQLFTLVNRFCLHYHS